MTLPDGRMLVGFHQSHVPRSHPVRLIRTNRDGTVDPSFTAPSFHEAPDPDAPLSYGWLSRVIDQPDGRLLVVGNFGAVNGELHPGIVRLLPDGEIDPSFQIGTGANAGIWTALVERGGKIVLGGHFDHFNGIPHRKSVRLNPDGTVDPTFRADFEVLGGILSIVRQGEHYLMCGYFNSVNEQHASHIARLNPDGSPDPTFRASTSGTVFGLAVLPDQRFYAWGMFRSPQQGIARFGPDGVIDPEFRPPLLNGVIFDAHPLPDDRVLIAGMFSRTADHPGGIAILHSDGSIDREFDAGLYPSGFVGLYPTGFVGGLQPNADGSLFLLGNMQLDGNLPMRQLLRIRNLPIPPVISTIRVSGGQGQVHLQATRGLTHSLEQSVDFTSWRSIGAAYPSGSTLTLDFEELDAKETKNFYRIRLLPPESGH